MSAIALQPDVIALRQMQQLYSENNYLDQSEEYVGNSFDHEQQSQLCPSSPKGGSSPIPHFEYLSYDRVQYLYEQRKGHFYFIPEGFEPVLVPNDFKAQTVTNLLENSKPVSTAPNVSRMLPDTDVRLPSFALPCGVASSAKKEGSINGKNGKVKKPPRPPNAFILYRRAKQPTIVALHHGISNNEVSKEIGRMWHEEPLEVRNKFQKMAEAAKEEHMKKYPEYRYRPRRPQERKRRAPTRDAASRRQSAPVLPQNLQSHNNSLSSIQRGVSSSADVDNGYLSDSQLVSVQNSNQRQSFYSQSPETASPPDTFSLMDDSVSQYAYLQNSFNGDFTVFDGQSQEYIDYEGYNNYNNQMASLNYSVTPEDPYRQLIPKIEY
ncbi:6451_t:CDS:1 [Acaulospora colombiana]|uniref:6451_t:CDS:1 n=1 Tax=Acaulospora colombiana TaxID=27376 RepID=A0ACA9L9Y6_9GLOM|nr:6451_t:CDS:1 [Acaulospora colombiana]